MQCNVVQVFLCSNFYPKD